MFQRLEERLHIETVPAIHLRPALHFTLIRSRLELIHVLNMSERCVYTGDWLHAHAKYSPCGLPVKQITFREHAKAYRRGQWWHEEEHDSLVAMAY
jgi:hypothetical protein